MAQPQLKLQHPVRDWPFKVKPLHPVLGCEITGITLAEAVSPAMFAKVYEAFLDYELILFRDVDLPPATQVAFARITWSVAASMPARGPLRNCDCLTRLCHDNLGTVALLEN